MSGEEATRNTPELTFVETWIPFDGVWIRATIIDGRRDVEIWRRVESGLSYAIARETESVGGATPCVWVDAPSGLAGPVAVGE